MLDVASSAPLTARRKNVLRSPKQYGSSLRDARPYLEELGVRFGRRRSFIQFQPNTSEPDPSLGPPMSRDFRPNPSSTPWTGYREEYGRPIVADPFVRQRDGNRSGEDERLPSFGVELNPLLHFIAQVKVSTRRVSPSVSWKLSAISPPTVRLEALAFLQSERHFRLPVLRNLERLKGGIEAFRPATEEDVRIRDLMLLAFASILVDCSNLKRSPRLGYAPAKFVEDEAPFTLFAAKIAAIAETSGYARPWYRAYLDTLLGDYPANSMEYQPPSIMTWSSHRRRI